ncbi:MAG: MoaD/ThiS family protein [Candidatus Obscuribacterales bacterium]|nr:MoaD/ThiS family protein [Candidatus Obscuribacterales bacterium]
MLSAKTIRVSYFALFREQSGRANESCSTEAATLSELYDELKLKYGFSMQQQNLRVAKNAEFCPWESSLSNGDEVAFIPPVAGG